MRRARWIVKAPEGSTRPVLYHCISRVVDRRFVLGAEEKEKFRTLMRMQEKFTGCRVLSYCLMDNHIHLLLEVPSPPSSGLTDAELLKRLSSLYSDAFVAGIAQELAAARAEVYVQETGLQAAVHAIHQRFSYRMHDLGQFMKGLLQRYTQWHNRAHSRTGRLWEDRFKSLIVEDGHAAKTLSAYIDLNPVRAGIVTDPADYRWSSYGEAIGGGPKGNGKTARAGLVRALTAHQNTPADATLWSHRISREYRKILMAGALGKSTETIDRSGKTVIKTLRKGISQADAEAAGLTDGEIPFGKILRCRIRYFTDGAVMGSRAFVDEIFQSAKHRFGPNRQTGARKLRGPASPANHLLWSLRDLKKGNS